MTLSKAYSVVWTETAETTANSIVQYLKQKWTQKEVDHFLDEIEKIIKAIKVSPKLFKASKKRENIHLALVTKHSYLIYQLRPAKHQIVILLLWDTRRNPKKLKY